MLVFMMILITEVRRNVNHVTWYKYIGFIYIYKITFMNDFSFEIAGFDLKKKWYLPLLLPMLSLTSDLNIDICKGPNICKTPAIRQMYRNCHMIL